jgi:hypothetical protein
MKKRYSTGLLSAILFLLVLSSTPSNAQPCGLQSDISVYGGVATVTYAADSSGFLPGWDAYAYEWWVNNDLFSTQSAFLDWLPSGYNLVCLKVFGTNSSTGDSCTSEFCNVYQSTGDAIYPYFDINVNGLTVDFSGSYYGGNSGNPDITFDFGDGNQITSSSLSQSHTYAAPGYYPVYMYVQSYDVVTGMATGQTGRYINVDNGFGNLEIQPPFDNTYCDTVDLSVTSIPPYVTGHVAINNQSVPFTNLIPGSPVTILFNNIPGHDFLNIYAQDPNNGDDILPYLVFSNSCINNPDTIQGSVYDDLNFNGLRDVGEPGLIGKEVTVTANATSDIWSSIDASYSAVTDANGDYSILVPHTDVSVSLVQIAGYRLTFPGSCNYNVSFNSGTAHPGYNWGLSALTTKICGTTYLDDDQNGAFTSTSDRRFPSVNISVLNTITGVEYHTWSNQNGTYCIDLPPGNFIVKATYFLLDSATVAPDSIIVNSPSGGTFNNNNFGFTSPVPVNFGIRLVCADQPRPGFDINLTARVHNSGFVNGKGTVVLQYDPALTSLSVTPSNGVVNTVNNTITWITDTIKTGQQVHYSGRFNIPASTPLGTLLSNSVSVTAQPGFQENDLTNNNSSLVLTVIGSFDPNDKAVQPAGYGSTGDVHHETRLDYRIRFQNTGTASAIHVIVTDTIDDDLNLNTFMMHRASHNYQLVTNGRIFTWKFFNINLPDSNTNEPLSHGFIEYSIQPVQGLPDGVTIENSANIYFDFNAPVITNTTLNTLQTNITSVGEIPMDASLVVYPVPAGNLLYIQPRSVTSGVISLALFDIAGKQVREIFTGEYKAGTILSADLSGLAQGIYFLQLEQNGVRAVSKVMKQ